MPLLYPKIHFVQESSPRLKGVSAIIQPEIPSQTFASYTDMSQGFVQEEPTGPKRQFPLSSIQASYLPIPFPHHNHLSHYAPPTQKKKSSIPSQPPPLQL